MKSPATSTELLMAQVFLDIAVVLGVGAFLGQAVRRFRQPVVIGEILAGIMLGPSLLGLLPGNPSGWLFPVEARPYLSVIAQVGLVLFMFLIGWDFNPALLARRGSTAAGVSIGSMAVSFGLGVGLAAVLYRRHHMVGGEHPKFVPFVLFIGVAMSITAFPVLARILVERGIAGRRVGAIALASAAIDDVVAWCLLALVAAVTTASGVGELIAMLMLIAAYCAVLFLVVRPLLVLVVGRWSRGYPSPFLLVFVVALILLSSYATTWIGLHAIFGAFCIGLVMPREPVAELRTRIRLPLETTSALLLPVFFIVSGLGVDMAELNRANVFELAAILAVACIGKFTGAVVPALSLGMSLREAGIIGVLVNTRGLTELIALNVGVQLGVLDRQMFTMMVLMALITTALTGPLISGTWSSVLSVRKADAKLAVASNKV